VLETLELSNVLCNQISETAWAHKEFSRFGLQTLVYQQARTETKLAAQLIIRCIAKVADAYKKDKNTQRVFKKHGAIPFDDRILKIRNEKQFVSIWTVAGRQQIQFVCGEHQAKLLQFQKGESDLVYSRKHNCFYLLPTCDIPEIEKGNPDSWLGIDLGQVNIAVTSDEVIYNSKEIERNRVKAQTLRSNLQSVKTKSAKRHLKRLSGKQRRFQRDVNHVLSKRLVLNAERTKRGIALEDLTHIRKRTRVKGRENRARRTNWSFRQLRDFISYKAEMHGIAITLVNPAYTSQRCPVCGHVEAANRKSQSEFRCKACGHTAHADVNAAKNVAWAAVRQPIVSDFIPVLRTEIKVLGTSPRL
jgi:IS605 OrfB family transposase